MRDRIAEAAKRNGRSMNSELISTLERIYPALEPDDAEIDPDEWREQEIEATVDSIEAQVRRLRELRSMKWPDQK